LARYSDLLVSTGAQVRSLCQSPKLRGFTDDYVDRIIITASEDNDPTIRLLASCIVERKRPRLLVEISGVEQKSSNMISQCANFRQRCRDGLDALIKNHGLLPGQFLLCGPKPIKFEERGSLLTRSDIDKLKPDEREELIMIFQRGTDEPRSIVDIDNSILHVLSNQVYAIQRLYLVEGDLSKDKSDKICQEVRKWATPPE
jgi:hypothetical protein